MKKLFGTFLILLSAASISFAAQSAWVYFDNTHTLVYSNDNMGNHLPDFSFAGYEGGGVAIPTNVPVKQTLNPVAGDNTTQIQNAINAVSALTADANGFRGVVLLNPGTYQIAGMLTISSGGVILRGSGNNTNTGTILLVTGNGRNVLTVTGSGSWSKTGSTYTITNSYTPLGATNFGLNTSPAFSVGSTIVVQRPWTTNWIHAIGMDLLTQPWTAGTGLEVERTVTAINGTQVTIDDPLVNPIESVWTTGQVFQVTDTKRIQQVGVENLCAEAQFADYPSNILTGVFCTFNNIKNGWMQNIYLTGWGNGLSFGGGSKWCTAQDCIYALPGTGTSSAAPAAWTISGTLCLFQRCTSSGGYYHIMVTQDSTPGPNVFLNFNCTGTHYNGGPHQRWAAGVLHDVINMSADTEGNYTPYLAINNRGNDGSGQGWSAGFSVMYNCQVPQFQLEQPATTTNQYNWTIGGIGSADNYSDKGIYDALGSIVSPHSLYLEQLKERLGGAAVENIGYALFTITNAPLSRTVGVGTNTTFAVTVGDPTLMSNIVALSVSGLPANLGAGFSTNSIVGAGNATLTLTASNSIVPGNYTLNVIGANAGLTHTSVVSVVVGNPSFSMSVNPSSQTIIAGNGTNFTVNVVTNNNFTGVVNLSVSGLPAGANANFNPASLGGSGSSTLTVTTTTNISPGNYTLTVTGIGADLTNISTVTLVVNSGAAGAAGTFIWNGPGAGNNNWSAAGDWLPVALPGISNDVKFFDPGAAGAVSNINNVVDANLTVQSLQYGNTNGFHTTQIAYGKTLSVVGSGGLTVGTETDNGTTQSDFATITGAGGALIVSNAAANLIIRQGGTNSGSALKATLDLSGLDNFSATVANVAIGSLGANARPSGTLYLAKTNLIVASGSTPAIQVGGQGGGSGNGGNGSFLYLGQTNSIFANGISVATVKQGNCSMLFNPALANPAAYFRAADGAGRVPNWLIGDSGNSGGTVNTTGTNDFTGGTVDALVDVMTLGNSSTSSKGSGSPSGTLTFGTGTIDVNTLQIGYQHSGGGSTNNSATGTVNVNGAATLAVNVGMELGHVSVAVGTNATKGTLNLNGGTVQATNIFGGGGISIINLNGGTLDLQAGNPAPGKIANVVTLNIGANGASSPAVLENAATISVSNAITIAVNGTIAGDTFITSPGLIVNGTISPGIGGGIGAITNSGTVTFGSGGSLIVAVQDADGAPVMGWSFLQTAGKMDVQSADTNPFTISPQSFNPDNSGFVTNFNDDTNYDWVIAAAAGGITNFSTDKFIVDSSLFGNDLAGGYFYVRTNSNSLVLSFTNNHPPSAGTVMIYRTGNPMAIPTANLATNWSDPDGDPVTLASVDSSTNDADLGNDGSFIYYTNANNAADEIFYTVEDVRTNPPATYRPGDTQRTATGQIILLPPPAIVKISINGNNLVFNGAGGISGGAYYLLASTNLALPLANWTPIATNSFDMNGSFSITNPVGVNNLQQFYLLKFP